MILTLSASLAATYYFVYLPHHGTQLSVSLSNSHASTSTSGPRYLSLNIWTYDAFWAGPHDDTYAMIDKAQSEGFNAIRFQIYWPTLEPSAGNFNWSKFDDKIAYAVSKGMKISISFNATPGDGSGILPESELMHTQDGRIYVAGGFGNNMISFASDEAVAKANSAFQAIVSRYNSRYADSIIFYQVTLSPFAETEYYPNQLLDYSAPAKSAFRSWLLDKYGTVTAMNAAVGTHFDSFSVVQPPIDQSGEFGLDWYRFRSDMLKKTIDAFASTAHSAGAKFGVQFGSVWDSAVPARGTVLFPQIAANADWVTVDDGGTYDHKFSTDYLRGSLPGKYFGNEIDNPANPGVTDAIYISQGQETFNHGFHFISIANWSLADLTDHSNIISALVPYLSDPAPSITGSSVMPISSLDLLRNGPNQFLSNYVSQSGSETQTLDVVANNDFYPNQVNRVSNHSPTGSFDVADCDRLAGWASDPDTPDQPITVHYYDSANYIGATTANIHRGDVGDHGFSISTPDSLKDNRFHNISAWGIDSDGDSSKNVSLGSQTIKCSSEVPPTVTPTPTESATPTPSQTATPTPTLTATPTLTITPTPTPTPASIPGDINGDGVVNLFDLNILSRNYGQTGSNSADINGDGQVNLFDFNILVRNYGRHQ